MRPRYLTAVRRLTLLTLVLAPPSAIAQTTAARAFPGRASTWHGYARHDFQVDGRPCIVVAPERAAGGRPWIWRARFFGHEPQADVALLGRGYHVAYCDVGGLFGSPAAVAHWNSFYATLTARHGLAKKPALEGMSRGGLIIYNWAAANPDKVACLYGDAPVCDFKSWPGAIGGRKGKGSPAAWQTCMAAYGMTREQALAYTDNPIDNLAPLAQARIPLLHIFGDADPIVPPAENTAEIARRYRARGGEILLIAKKGVGHHPHALANPRTVVEFVVGRCRLAGADTSASPPFADNVIQRGSLANSRRVFTATRCGHVAFMGGSITEMNGYRPMVGDILRRRFPQTTFTFTDAGIASTGSMTGAFRLATDVLSKGPVNLFFLEFAVNDEQDAHHARRTCIRGMEGIVRQIRDHNPFADIVIVQFLNPRMRDALLHGETPLTIGAHETVAAHYRIPSIVLAREVTDRILRGELTWRRFGGTHPAKPGNALAAEMIDSLLDRAWSAPTTGKLIAHPSPALLDPGSYVHGAFLDPQEASLTDGWQTEVPDWSRLPGSKRARFTKLPMLCADKPESHLTLKFHGTAIGAYVVAGPDAGILEGRIDGHPIGPVNLYHRFSRGLHYPRTVMFGEALSPGDHVLELHTASTTESRGYAARIMQFTVNDPTVPRPPRAPSQSTPIR